MFVRVIRAVSFVRSEQAIGEEGKVSSYERETNDFIGHTRF